MSARRSALRTRRRSQPAPDRVPLDVALRVATDPYEPGAFVQFHGEAALTAPPPPIPFTRPRKEQPHVVFATSSSSSAGGALALFVAMACGFDGTVWRRTFMLEHADATLHAPYARKLEAAGIPIAPFSTALVERADIIVYWGMAMPNSVTSGGVWPPMVVVAHSAVGCVQYFTELCARHTVHGIGANGATARLIERTLGWADGSVPVVWTYCDPETPITPRGRVPRGQGSSLTLGYVGRLSIEKNVATLLAALATTPDDVSLVIYGDGPLENLLYGYVREIGLRKRVEFRGAVEDTARVYEAFDALVIPSFYEGLPVVLGEAFRAECPVIVTPHGDARLICGDGRADLARAPTIDALYEAIMELRRAPERDVRAARAFALAHLDERRMAESVANHTAAVLNGLRPARV